MRTCWRVVLPVLVLTALLTAVAGSAFAAEAPFVPFDLGTLGGNASAHAVNNSGRVVGVVAGARFRAFSWTSAEGMIDLGTLGCSGESEAIAVNASGQVVGSATTCDSSDHAFSWTPRGGMIDLGTLGGRDAHDARHLAVEAGQMAVIAAAFLLVGWHCSHRDWYRRRVVVPASVLIACTAAYWTVARLAV